MNNLSKPSVSVIIPTYNNSSTIVSQINECIIFLRKITSKYEIIICDDGSSDETFSLLQANFTKFKEVRIIQHYKNKGVAKTLRQLYKAARYRYVALYSADGDWKISDLRKLILFAFKKEVGIVIGKRRKQTYTPYRRLVSYIYNLIPRILFGVNTIDAGSIKVISKEIIDQIKLESSSIFFEAELIIKADKKGYTISSLPVQYKKNDSKVGLRANKMILNSLKDILLLKITGLS